MTICTRATSSNSGTLEALVNVYIDATLVATPIADVIEPLPTHA